MGHEEGRRVLERAGGGAAPAEEATCAGLQLELLVARLVAKTREAALLAAEQGLLGAENERGSAASAAPPGPGRGQEGGGRAGVALLQAPDLQAAMRDMSAANSKKVVEVQGQLVELTSQLEQAREAGECAERLLRAEQEKQQQQGAG